MYRIYTIVEGTLVQIKFDWRIPPVPFGTRTTYINTLQVDEWGKVVQIAQSSDDNETDALLSVFRGAMSKTQFKKARAELPSLKQAAWLGVVGRDDPNRPDLDDD